MKRPASRNDAAAGRHVRRRWSRGAALGCILLVSIVARRGCETMSPPPAPSLPATPGAAFDLVRVVDGDTILVRQRGDDDEARPARVRLLGIDAPESVTPDHPVEPWGPEAGDFAREFLARGPLELRFDRRRKDRYDRFLAYVYVEGEMLNEALVRAGLARVSHYPGDSPQIARRLRDAEEEARGARRGVWSDQ